MKQKEFLDTAALICDKTCTAYMWGCCGYPVTPDLISKKAKQYPSRYSAARQIRLLNLVPIGVWGWDCAGLIKGILWGWNNDATNSRGGATYASNDIPDTNVSGLLGLCSDVSSDFSKIHPGELVFMDGHVGIYEGGGKVIEATLSGILDGVVRTDLMSRGWTKHGKLEFIEYEEEEEMLKIHVQKEGLRIRSALTFSGTKPTGTPLAIPGQPNNKKYVPVGKDLRLIEFIPGIQPDGYQWCKTEYNGVTGYSQYDSKCYYIFKEV